jgi:hypothetical protein
MEVLRQRLVEIAAFVDAGAFAARRRAGGPAPEP